MRDQLKVIAGTILRRRVDPRMLLDPPEGRCRSRWKPGAAMRCSHLRTAHADDGTGPCQFNGCGCQQYTE